MEFLSIKKKRGKDVKEKANPSTNTPQQEDAIRKLRTWYERDKAAKRFIIDEWKEMYKLYKGDHWDLLGSNGVALRTATEQNNRPNCVENVTFALIEGTASEFAQDVELVDFPVEEGDEDAANVMSELKKFIFYKNKITSERVKMLRWFFLYGTLIIHPYWDPDWKGGKGPNRWSGDIRWKALHPIMIYPDARCKEDINEGNRCHKVVWPTIESISENYPDRADAIQNEIQDDDDLLDDDQEDADGFNVGDSRQDMVPVIETWYKGSPLILDDGEEDQGPGLHVIWWAGEEQGVYLKHANYMYYDPGESVEFPFFLKQRYPRENSVWGFGEAYYLKTPQIVRNKTAEIILEGHMHASIGQTLYDENSVTPLQRKVIREKGTIPGMWFAIRNIDGINRMQGQSVPSSLLAEADRLQKVMESIIGRFDISQGKTPGSVTAFRAIAELSARAQVRLRLAEQAITGAYEQAGQFTNRLIERFYDEGRRYRIRGKEDELFHKSFSRESVMKVYHYGTNQVFPLSEVKPEGMSEEEYRAMLSSQHEASGGQEGMAEDDYEIYFPDFDTVCRVTSVVPADRIYHMEIAKELLAGGIIDVETFMDVMRTGRFPPIEKVLERQEVKRKRELEDAVQKQMMSQTGVNLPGQGMEGTAGGDQNKLLEAVSQFPPEIQQQLAQLPPEDLPMAIEQLSAGGGMGSSF